MPSIPVTVDPHITAGIPGPQPTLDDYSTIISTNNGLAIIEIQGDLSLPKEIPATMTEKEQQLFSEIDIPTLFKSIHMDNEETRTDKADIVKFGRLEIDDNMKKATLFISTTQRLLGSIEKIDPPLGLLKIDHVDKKADKCEIVDVLSKKIIFKQRPLPIM